MISLDVLDELLRVGSLGAGPEQIVGVLDGMTDGRVLGLFTSQEPAGFRLHLTRAGRDVLDCGSADHLAARLSELLEAAESAALPPSGSGLEIVAGGTTVSCYPVAEGGAVVGGLLTLRTASGDWPEMHQLRGLLEVLLSRASLQAQTRAYEKALDFLNEIYRHNLEDQEAGAALGAEFTLSRLADLFGFDAAALALPDGEEWKVLYWMATETPPEFIRAVQDRTLEFLSREPEERQAEVVQNILWQHRPPPAGQEPRSYFMLPLLFDPQGRRPGGLALYSAREELLTPDELRLLVLMTPGLSIAFRNSQLLFALERQAKIDEMSGLYNYRTFRALLGREFKRLVRHQTPLSLLLLDIDHFKQVNDTHGHQVGDEVLRGLARILMEIKRGVDAVARYGGEEFVMILPETGLEGASQLAERVRARVAASRMLADRPVTVSIGVATFTSPDTGSEDELIHRADKALYRAKQSGRNRVEIDPDSKPERTSSALRPAAALAAAPGLDRQER